MEHAPEPWKYTGEHYNDHGGKYREIVGADGDVVIGEYGTITEDDARRIVACVNACKGLPTKDLEQTWGDGGLFEFIATSDHDALREEDRADALAARLEEAKGLLRRFLGCAEIADCAPEDMENETRDVERETRAFLNEGKTE